MLKRFSFFYHYSQNLICLGYESVKINISRQITEANIFCGAPAACMTFYTRPIVSDYPPLKKFGTRSKQEIEQKVISSR